MRPLDFPNNIQIQTTSFCNASCNFCPYPETSREQPMGRMDDELFRSLIDQIACHPVSLIQPFLMNDPLMDKQIVQRLAYIKEKVAGARVNITTNAGLLRASLARELARLDLDSIHVSSNGIKADTYRKTMGIDALTVLSNVNTLADELRRAGAGTELIITALLLDSTRDEIFIAREYWRARGVTFLMNPVNDRAGNIRFDRFEDLLPFETEVNRSQLLSYDMSGCPALYSFLGVLYNGDLVTCCMDWRRTLVLGNARDNSLCELWRDHPYRQIRKLSDEGRLGKRPLCRKCGKNRFSIDPDVLHQLLKSQAREHGESNQQRLARQLHQAWEDDKEAIKMNLVRPT